ncbi:unnamed protein product, partial [Amoebophrya sp. A120]|eukprot:GSA120T00026295001.1
MRLFLWWCTVYASWVTGKKGDDVSKSKKVVLIERELSESGLTFGKEQRACVTVSLKDELQRLRNHGRAEGFPEVDSITRMRHELLDRAEDMGVPTQLRVVLTKRAERRLALLMSMATGKVLLSDTLEAAQNKDMRGEKIVEFMAQLLKRDEVPASYFAEGQEIPTADEIRSTLKELDSHADQLDIGQTCFQDAGQKVKRDDVYAICTRVRGTVGGETLFTIMDTYYRISKEKHATQRTRGMFFKKGTSIFSDEKSRVDGRLCICSDRVRKFLAIFEIARKPREAGTIEHYMSIPRENRMYWQSRLEAFLKLEGPKNVTEEVLGGLSQGQFNVSLEEFTKFFDGIQPIRSSALRPAQEGSGAESNLLQRSIGEPSAKRAKKEAHATGVLVAPASPLRTTSEPNRSDGPNACSAIPGAKLEELCATVAGLVSGGRLPTQLEKLATQSIQIRGRSTTLREMWQQDEFGNRDRFPFRGAKLEDLCVTVAGLMSSATLPPELAKLAAQSIRICGRTTTLREQVLQQFESGDPSADSSSSKNTAGGSKGTESDSAGQKGDDESSLHLSGIRRLLLDFGVLQKTTTTWLLAKTEIVPD